MDARCPRPCPPPSSRPRVRHTVILHAIQVPYGTPPAPPGTDGRSSSATSAHRAATTPSPAARSATGSPSSALCTSAASVRRGAPDRVATGPAPTPAPPAARSTGNRALPADRCSADRRGCPTAAGSPLPVQKRPAARVWSRQAAAPAARTTTPSPRRTAPSGPPRSSRPASTHTLSSVSVWVVRCPGSSSACRSEDQRKNPFAACLAE